jgi:hypothetical protein
VLINLELVDRMLSAIIDGFGAVPKRGVEVGGLLLGSRVRTDGKLQVTVDDYVAIPCSHRFGPSYVLSDEDRALFEKTILESGNAIGYFRSHTREGLGLGAEDLQYCQSFFSNPDDIMLLVKPSAIKVSKGAFFYYLDGELQERTDFEFPFRRSELETGEAPARRPLGERRPPPSFEPPVARPPRPGETVFADPIAARDPFGGNGAGNGGGAFEEELPPPSPRQRQFQAPPDPMAGPPAHLPPPPSFPAPGPLRKNWVWFPLSFIFLLLGVLLGFQAAMSFNATKGSSQDPYAISLGVERRQDDLSVRWDRSNQAIRTASKGILEIQDGKYAKRVDLDSAQMQTGSVIYRFSSDTVRFKLEVYPRDRVVISEWVEWKGSK